MSTVAERSLLRRWLVPVVCTVTLLIPIVVWLISTHGPVPYFTHHVPPGQRFYILSKLCGLLALPMLWLQCMTALARFAPALRGFFSLPRWQHIALGATTFTLVLTHLAFFIAASSLRTGHLALPLLVPKFDAGFYTAFVSLGAVAFWLLLLVVIAGLLRMSGHGWMQWVHRLSFGVFGVAFLHGIAIGSETRFGLMKYIYVFIGLSLATALMSWIAAQLRLTLRQRRTQETSNPTSVAGTANGR